MDGVVLGGRHMGIPVKNMERMLHFYEGVLGFSRKVDELEEGSYIETVLAIPGAKLRVVKLVVPNAWMLELIEYKEPVADVQSARKINSVGNGHLALSVKNADDCYKLLRDAGINCLSAPCDSPNGYARVFFCQDPEGNHIELVQVK